ncbi:hypothetical protein RND81_03G089000 [Saponaria officinalis]|uniref:DUF4378 domain-containing protein n=1 Tax=Saponaria officinalis TaxID=3572 RepID=A0AAW1M748_SAPOF
MSAKLLYSLSGENLNQQKQMGCMNGFLQFFDPHHFISGRSNGRILPPDENRTQVGRAAGATKKTKEKRLKVIKTTQGNSSESSRISVSSSSASTTFASVDCEWSVKNDKFQSPIKTLPREQAARHGKNRIDSPRLLQSPKHDSPRLVARNDSFRSTSSNQSAPVLPLRKRYPDEPVKDSPRLSHDTREARETYISSLKLRDLPRLSLDSRQQTIKKFVHESKDDLVLRHLQREAQNPRNAQNLPKEPASSRPPSNVVAKLMGLEALSDCNQIIKTQIEQNDPSVCGSSSSLSRSSRTSNESRVKRVSKSRRENSGEAKTQQTRKDKPPSKVSKDPVPWKTQEEQQASSQVTSKNQELSHEPKKHTITVYANIEKRMNDLDFKRSGKDLRALKHILDSIHREKTKLLSTNEDMSSDNEFTTCSNSSTYMSLKQGLRNEASQDQDHIGHMPLTGKESRSTKDTKSRDTKPYNFIRDSKKEAAFAIQDLPLKSLHRIKIGKPGNNIKEAAQKKSTKHNTPMANHFHDPSHQTHCTTRNKSGERTPRPKTASKGQPTMTVNVPSPVRSSKTISNNIYSHTPATAICSKTSQHKPNTKGLRSQTPTLQQKLHILTNEDGHSEVIRCDPTFRNQENNTNTNFSKGTSERVSQMQSVLANTDHPGIKSDTWLLAINNKNAKGVSGDTTPEELAIVTREQPSPVSVLDANFYGDESPSPVKKKPTAFRDYETNAAYKEAEWRDIDLTYLPNTLGPTFSCEKEDVIVENFSQTVQTLKQVDNSRGISTETVDSQEEENHEKAYVSEILAASGILDDISSNAVNVQLGQLQAIDPKLFIVLEQTKESRYLPAKRSTGKEDTIMGHNGRHQRKLLFDIVNEILSQKLSSTGLGMQPRLVKKISAPTTDIREVLQEICTEINQFQANSSHQGLLDDENDFLAAIIEKDLSHATGNWGNISSEIPRLVLDVERLIFKDLIAELIN